MTLANYSFSTRIGVAMVTLSLLLSVLVSSYFGWRGRELIRQETTATLTELAFQMCDKLDRGMFERYREIDLMTTWPVLANLAIDPLQKRAVLQRLKDTYPMHAWIGLTDKDGNVIAGSDGLLEGKNVSARPWFSAGLQGNYVGDVHGALLLSKYMLAPPDGNLRFVDVAAPVRDAHGEVIGVLCSHLSWEWAREVRDTLLRGEDTMQLPELLVANRDGEVLLGPAALQTIPPELMTQIRTSRATSGATTLVWPDGREYLVGFSRDSGFRDYPGLGWTVIVREHAVEAFLPAQQLQQEIFVYGIGLGLILSLIGIGAAWRLGRPLRQIAAEADLIRQGEMTLEEITLVPGDDEVATLSRSLIALVNSIEHRNHDLAQARDRLEERVRERTAALESVNRNLAMEISRRRQGEEELRQSESHLKEAQQLARLGSFDEREDGLHWSDELYRLLGYEPYEVLPSRELLLETVCEADRPLVRRMFSGVDDPHPQGEWRLGCGEMSEKIVSVSLTRLDHRGENPRWSGILMDISERKRNEELREDVERIIRHDLRTPLNAILNFPLLMLADENLTDDQRQNLKFIRESGEKMLAQIDLSLKLYKMETGTYQVEGEAIELLPLLQRLHEEFISLLQQQQVRFDLRLPFEGEEKEGLRLWGEKLLVSLMFSNLLKNAIEASPVRGVVTLSVELRDKGVCVTIHNMGAVPDALRRHFFDKYSTCGKRGGTGLGTYLARQVVKVHGGEIGYLSSSYEGTTVWVEWPFKEIFLV